MKDKSIEEMASFEKRQKSYHELTFTDNFMFCKIMEKNPELCKRLLEMILEEPIKRIVYVNKEEALDVSANGKSVRLDVYVDDEDGTVYDMEMQTTTNPNIPKRLRYYQGMIDLNLIEKGADYIDLKKCFIILICTYDYFNQGLPVYTFSNRCKESCELELGDDTYKIILNPYGKSDELSDDMRAFLDYLLGKVDEENQFVHDVEEEVKAARNQEDWKVEYMTLQMRDRENFREGKAEGKAEEIVKFLSECGTVSTELYDRIFSESDLEELSRLLKLAARVSSIKEFEENM